MWYTESCVLSRLFWHHYEHLMGAGEGWGSGETQAAKAAAVMVQGWDKVGWGQEDTLGVKRRRSKLNTLEEGEVTQANSVCELHLITRWPVSDPSTVTNDMCSAQVWVFLNICQEQLGLQLYIYIYIYFFFESIASTAFLEDQCQWRCRISPKSLKKQ